MIMKEYKVINWKPGLYNNAKKLEETLNKFASEGWRVIHIAERTVRIVFERDKVS